MKIIYLNDREIDAITGGLGMVMAFTYTYGNLNFHAPRVVLIIGAPHQRRHVNLRQFNRRGGGRGVPGEVIS